MRKSGCAAYNIFGSRAGLCPLGGFFVRVEYSIRVGTFSYIMILGGIA